MDVVSRGANIHFCFPSQIRSNLRIILRVTPAPDLQTQLPVGNWPPDFKLKPAAQLLGWCRTLVPLSSPKAGPCCIHPMPAPPSSAHLSPSSKLGLVGALLLSESRRPHDQSPRWWWKAGLPAASE